MKKSNLKYGNRKTWSKDHKMFYKAGELKKLNPANPLHLDYHPALLLSCAGLTGHWATHAVSSELSMCLPNCLTVPFQNSCGWSYNDLVTAFQNHKACVNAPALRTPWLLVASVFKSYWVEGDLDVERQNHHAQLVNKGSSAKIVRKITNSRQNFKK